MSNSDDRMSELKAFDKRKTGVKGLVDEGVTKIPTLFYHPPEKFPIASYAESTMIPVIDLEGVAKDPITRQQVASTIREACETWGFFQVVNHGIPHTVLEDMKDGVRRFFEQDVEVKKDIYIYSRDNTKVFNYNNNFDLNNSSPLNERYFFMPISSSYSQSSILAKSMQILTNDRFKSAHRVLSNLIGPRISVACFFGYSVPPLSKLLGPIKELLSENNPPRFKEITIAEYVANFRAKGLGSNPIEDYRT
ncbi:hypothetical protein PIB30_089722 [Stylosanthes scabra]|uniref:Non-haem dioxygenase N-terminal domain-containing protein n=1 Tax=Stylosanthes scabra TaxID=79078 RepID=A0ABU6TWB3_9FABA|nr:hypothetical protein [Stylosanthes scabra]